MDEFDHSQSGLPLDYGNMSSDLNVGVPPLSDLTDMAKGTYDFAGSVSEAQFMGRNSGLDMALSCKATMRASSTTTASRASGCSVPQAAA